MHAQDRRSRANSSSTPQSDGTVADGRHPSLIRLHDGGRSLIREVNCQIEELSSEWDEDGSAVVFCECGERECLEKIEISHIAYERIRGSATHFLVKPDHVAEQHERVITETDDYAVVEKLAPRSPRADRPYGHLASRNEREAQS